jgi:hypothetical protein
MNTTKPESTAPNEATETTLQVNPIEEVVTPISKARTTTTINPWRGGTFYLFSVVVIIIVLTAIVPASTFVQITLTTTVFLGLIIIAELRSDGKISENTFISLFKIIFNTVKYKCGVNLTRPKEIPPKETQHDSEDTNNQEETSG